MNYNHVMALGVYPGSDPGYTARHQASPDDHNHRTTITNSEIDPTPLITASRKPFQNRASITDSKVLSAHNPPKT